MGKVTKLFGRDGLILLSISLLILIGTLVLRTVAPGIFPTYYIYLGASLVVFIMFWRLDPEIMKIFSLHLYIGSLLLLILPLIIGQVTRGAIRWIPLFGLSFQPSEIVRPFLFLFFAQYLIRDEIDFKHLVKSVILFLIPFFLILVQPSLGVSLLTGVGFFGVLLSSSINKKQIFTVILLGLAILPLIWLLLAPYQKERITGFLDPNSDPLGVGYNSIQSMISVGSGGVFGKGLGKGIQTQLAFLPERHTDFIFASIGEELGLIGTFTILLLLFIYFFVMSSFIDRAKDPKSRAFITAVLLSLLTEAVIHIGMNMGLLPITGVPLPFVSAGGSALIGTVISTAMVLNAKK
ncbi:MAG: Rod shape-determining protein RodA [Candidatus Woesebacteria bacterium GW2011_GWA1_37_8]|uniref:Probable peptidoglycan glycosyltransferase FtsW n=1 Tax=Candidatus Woesebacteria bacterium GW2011_GWA1_37_8 TaxID=1618546 RepID=A0A0G0HZ03_9BACT|nr:MAG: Rod shape-determining protein RodA [Candidatus Woesebacteria bacterium GW2011_GWA1_37_8]